MIHEGVGCFHGRAFNPLNTALWSPGVYSGVVDDAGSFGGALLGAGVEREDDGVARFKAHEGFEDSGGGGVGDGSDAGNHADGFRDLSDSGELVLRYDSHSF